MKISDKTLKLIEEEEDKCIGCNLCMEGCPMLARFCSSPKLLLKDLLDKKTFDYKLPYSCMLCGYCSRVCPTKVDLKSLFLELKREAVTQTNGKLPKDLSGSVVDFHQRFSFSKIFTSNINNLGSDTIFFPGCALMSYSPEIVQKTYSYLREKIPGIGIYNKCCGNPTASMGKDEKFKGYYSILEKEFKNKNIKKVITGCQNCFMTIGRNSKNIAVVSLWEVLASLGIPNERVNIGKDIDHSFTIHDPCPTRNINIIHKSIRDIASQLGLTIEEGKYSKSKTLCCGSGAMVSVTQGHIAQGHKKRVANEISTGHIVTYCQECVESIRHGGKKTYHILDLIFPVQPINRPDDLLSLKQENQSTLKRWVNRYKCKSIGK